MAVCAKDRRTSDIADENIWGPVNNSMSVVLVSDNKFLYPLELKIDRYPFGLRIDEKFVNFQTPVLSFSMSIDFIVRYARITSNMRCMSSKMAVHASFAFVMVPSYFA